jgi:hypothetical protein
MVSRNDQVLGFDCISDPLFDILKEMGAAEVPVKGPLADYCRFCTEEAGGDPSGFLHPVSRHGRS